MVLSFQGTGSNRGGAANSKAMDMTRVSGTHRPLTRMQRSRPTLDHPVVL